MRPGLITATHTSGEPLPLPMRVAPAHPVGPVRLGETVRGLGAELVQRHPSLAAPLATRDLGAAETSRRLDANAERTHAHRARHRFLHCPAEGDAALELQGDVL